MRTRFPPEVFILARLNNKLVGWLCVETNPSKMAELWRWQPFIYPGSNASEVAVKLIERAIAFTRKENQTRLEICFDRLTEETFPVYEKYRAWYESAGMDKMDESVYLEHDLSKPGIADNLEELRLNIYKEIMVRFASEIGKQKWVPDMIIGGGSGGNLSNSISDILNMLSLMVANQLRLQTRQSQQPETPAAGEDNK